MFANFGEEYAMQLSAAVRCTTFTLEISQTACESVIPPPSRDSIQQPDPVCGITRWGLSLTAPSILVSIRSSYPLFLVRPVACLDLLDLSFGHVAGGQYPILPDHIVRSARGAPVANRRPQRNTIPITPHLPVGGRQRCHHFPPAAATALVDGRSVPLTDVERALLELFRDVLDELRDEILDFHHQAED